MRLILTILCSICISLLVSSISSDYQTIEAKPNHLYSSLIRYNVQLPNSFRLAETPVPEPTRPFILTEIAPLPPELATSTSTPIPTLSAPPSNSCYLSPIRLDVAVNVRSSPSIDSAINATLPRRWSPVLGVYDSDNPEWRLWYQIDIGWVSAHVVTLSTPQCTRMITLSATFMPSLTPSPTSTPTISYLPSTTPMINSTAAAPKSVFGVFLAKSQEGSTNIYLISNGEYVPTQVTLEGEIYYPTISPVSSLIAYITVLNEVLEVKLLDIDTGEKITLMMSSLDQSIALKQLAWLPNGESILLTLTNAQNISSIYILRLNTEADIPTLLIENASAPSVSSDGTFVAFEQHGEIFLTFADVIRPLKISISAMGKCSSPAFSQEVFTALWFTCEDQGIKRFYYYDANTNTSLEIHLAEELGIDSNSINNLAPLSQEYITFDDSRRIYLGRINIETGDIIQIAPMIDIPNETITNISWRRVSSS